MCDCARRLGRDPRYAAVLVGLNPIYLVYAVGGFHNDFFMLVPSTGAIALLLRRRDRSAGAVLMLAVAVKFTAVLLLPFLLVGARTSARRRAVVGAVLAALPLIAMSLALFGLSLPNLSQQGTLLTPFSFPNMFGDAIGIGGGAPALLRLADVVLVLVVVWLVRRRGDWLSRAGWATVALIASLGMGDALVCDLGAAAGGAWIERAPAAHGAGANGVPGDHVPALIRKIWGLAHFNPLSGSAGQASLNLQSKLSSYP